MRNSDAKYAFLMTVFTVANIGISSSIAGMVGTFNENAIKLTFLICMIVGLIAISIFHWTYGRYMKFK
ncbi:putative membrane protein [Bacillus phage SP-15]|uniref:Putative membrane protein n=1 Tax=Bacillus phage SP-15 TaxID=1792032 RepID=A0A127AWR7_9CAUD|nr:hypothetical protein SP15_230 [Bacillus phage SP-15]AMM45032.1 putative membrane protein [Bacillus phage SP-15]